VTPERAPPAAGGTDLDTWIVDASIFAAPLTMEVRRFGLCRKPLVAFEAAGVSDADRSL
jgi:hypothetical protein